jgi:hypothetical protein
MTALVPPRISDGADNNNFKILDDFFFFTAYLAGIFNIHVHPPSPLSSQIMAPVIQTWKEARLYYYTRAFFFLYGY